MKTEIFDDKVLASLDKLSVQEARLLALSIVEKMSKNTVKQMAVLNRLIRDIKNAPSSIEVSRIMYQVYLSGTGFGTVGSAWKKHFSNV